VHWLLSAALVVLLLGSMLLEQIESWKVFLISLIPETYKFAAYIGVAGLYVIFSIAALCVILKRGSKRSERGFIVMDSSDNGRICIAISAVEQMVRQAVDVVDGVGDMKISISGDDDAIVINVDVAVNVGVHVPTVTMDMQHAIRRFVETNCGVAVKSVQISIKTVTEDGNKKGRRVERNKPVAPKEIPVPPAPVRSWNEPTIKEEAPVAARLSLDDEQSAPAYAEAEQTTSSNEEEPVSAAEE
jgi:Protein of unknown function (DUF322).